VSTINKERAFVIVLNLLVIGVLSFVFLNLVTIPLISPRDGIYTTERRTEFSWGGMQREFVIFLDDDPDFASPFTAEVSGNSYRLGKDMDFGTYYWKIESSGMSSSVREFTVGSSVVLAREENEVKNEGNVDLLLHRITGLFLLGVDESLEIDGDEDVKAEQA
jgi:hypothetical protein